MAKAIPSHGGKIRDYPSSSSVKTVHGAKIRDYPGTKKSSNKSIWDHITTTLSHAGSDTVGIIKGIGPGLAHTFKDLGLDIYHHPELLAIPYAAVPAAVGLRGTIGKSKTFNEIVKPIGSTYKDYYGPLNPLDFHPGRFLQNVEDHPTQFLTDALTVASGLVGESTKLGLLSKIEAGRTIPLAGPSGDILRELPLTGTQLSKRLQLGANIALKKLPKEMNVLGEWSRAAKEIRREDLVRDIGFKVSEPYVEYTQAFSKLSKVESTALGLIARLPLATQLKKFSDDFLNVDEVAPKFMQQIHDPEVLKLYHSPTDDMLKAYVAADNLGKMAANITRIDQTKDQLSMLFRENVAEDARYRHIRALGDTRPIDDIIGEIKSKDRPLPIYLPDVAEVKKMSGGQKGGGLAIPKSPIHHSRALLFKAGQFLLQPDVLSSHFMKSALYSRKIDLHDALLGSARKIQAGEHIPEGWVYIRVSPKDKLGHIAKTKSAFMDHLDEVVGGDDGLALTSVSKSDAMLDASEQFHYIVPKKFARQVTGEYTKSRIFSNKFINNPLVVWRALVLNLRVGWLTNNLLGNTFMYLMRANGVEGMKAFFQAVATEKGVNSASHVLLRKEVAGLIPAKDMARIFPEHTRAGTFLGSQAPDAGKLSKVLQSKKSPVSWLPRADKAWEAKLRQSRATAIAKASPEIKALKKSMGKDTYQFKRDAIKHLEGNPQLVRRISKQVDDSLGNFFALSDVEQGVVRQLIPFYAWYKAITILTLKLPFDAPGRTLILTQLGQLGEDINSDFGELPSFLKSGYPIGGNNLLQTSGINPYTTVPQVGLAVGALLPGSNREKFYEFFSMINPFISAAADVGVRAAHGDKVKKYGLFEESLHQIGKGLPQTRLYNALMGKDDEGTLYNNNWWTELSQYLGAPVKRVNKGEAVRRARRE